MNYKIISRYLALILAIEAVFMLPALAIALFDADAVTATAFMLTISVAIVAAVIFRLLSKNAVSEFFSKEGLVCVGVSWIVLGLVGCLPFFISGYIPNYIDALFEIVSGFTTTGASILTNVEGLSRGLLYWRSFSHWLGGMGVLVFIMAIAPGRSRDEGFAMHILRAESPGPDVGKLVPRMRQTASILYIIYIVLTVLNVIFLVIGRMPLFDAVCTAFGTAGTGGFGIKNDSIASYSPYIQNVCTVFMMLFGVNFSCYYLILLRRAKSVFQDEELRLYLGLFVGAVVLIVINLGSCYDTLSETVRHAAFQVASVMTTTGFATTDFNLWPSFSKTVLLILMAIGACAGSTGGGMKCSRLLLLVKSLGRNIRGMVNPQRVQAIRVNGKVIDEKVIASTNAYLAAYVIILFVSFLAISIDGYDITTNFSAVMACFNNIGPGLELVGPTGNYAMYSGFSKLVLIVDMLAGRLEIFPILIFLRAETWRR